MFMARMIERRFRGAAAARSRISARKSRRIAVETLEDRNCPAPYMLVTDNVAGSVLRYDGMTGAFVDTFVPADRSGMQGPDLGITADPAGADFLVDGYETHNVTRYSLADGSNNPAPGQSQANFVPPFSGGLENPEGISFGADGNLYVGDDRSAFGGQVLKYNGTSGASMGIFIANGVGGLGPVNDLKWSPDGTELFVTIYNTGQILRYDVNGTPNPTAGHSGANFVDPLPGYAGGITFDAAGNIYVAVNNPAAMETGSILRFDPNGNPMPADGQSGAVFVPQGSDGLRLVDGITIGPDGNLYVTDQFFHFVGQGMVRAYDGQSGQSLGVFVDHDSGGLRVPGGLLFYDDGTAPRAPGSGHHAAPVDAVRMSARIAARHEGAGWAIAGTDAPGRISGVGDVAPSGKQVNLTINPGTARAQDNRIFMQDPQASNISDAIFALEGIAGQSTAFNLDFVPA
jgi:hypothetical protein